MDGTVRIEEDLAKEVPAAAEPDIEISSATLARLMEEVRNAEDVQPTAYNRMHNRHNRS